MFSLGVFSLLFVLVLGDKIKIYPFSETGEVGERDGCHVVDCLHGKEKDFCGPYRCTNPARGTMDLEFNVSEWRSKGIGNGHIIYYLNPPPYRFQSVTFKIAANGEEIAYGELHGDECKGFPAKSRKVVKLDKDILKISFESLGYLGKRPDRKPGFLVAGLNDCNADSLDAYLVVDTTKAEL